MNDQQFAKQHKILRTQPKPIKHYTGAVKHIFDIDYTSLTSVR